MKTISSKCWSFAQNLPGVHSKKYMTLKQTSRPFLPLLFSIPQARATPEKEDSQRVAKWPIIEYQSLVLISFFRLSNEESNVYIVSEKPKLRNYYFQISLKIIVCFLSSKLFNFIHNRSVAIFYWIFI